MKNLLFMLYCLLTLSSITRAQELDVFSINTSQFPTVKAHYYAFDNDRRPLLNLTPSDFLIYENGIQRVISKVTSPTKGAPEKVSVAVGIDCSGSMIESEFDLPIELSKRMTSQFVRSLPLPANEVALQTCNDQPYITVDFTRDPQRLLDALEPVMADGSNTASEQLLYPIAGLLNITKEGAYDRIAVLCTDGKGPALSRGDIQRCKDTCTKYGIRFFAVLFASEESEPNGIKVSLRELAEATGGRVFDGIITITEAESVAEKLRATIFYGEPHILQWESENSCGQQKNVVVTVVPTGAESRLVYETAESTIARLITIPETIIDFGAIIPGQWKDTTITLTARNSSFVISEIVPTGAAFIITDYGGSAPPFTLLMDESRVLTIRFAPLDSARRYEKISFQNTLCTPWYSFLVGGFPGHESSQLLTLTRPTEDEVLVAGSTRGITWEGIPQGDDVSLDYSTNNGRSWSPITDNASGLLHEWLVPRTQSSECLMRVQSKSHQNNTSWARVIESSGSDGVASVTTDANGNVFICGYLGFETDFGGGFILPGPDDYNKRDMFIAKYDRAGKIEWAKKVTAGKAEMDQASTPSGLLTDAFGNVYMCGYFQSSFLDFGNGVKISQVVVEDDFDSFLVKYDEKGNPLWAKSIGGNRSDLVEDMSFDNAGNIYLGGHASGSEITVANTVTIRSATNDLDNGFLIKFTPEGKPLWGKLLGGKGAEGVTSVTCDAYDNIVVSGAYRTNDFILENGSVLASKGKINPFILKYSSEGNLLWGTNPTESSNEVLNRIRIDNTGDIYVSGYSEEHSITFHNGVLLKAADTSKRTTHFVAKYDPDGEIQWAHLSPFINSMFVDKSSQTLMTCGTYYKTADFGNGISFDDSEKHYSPGYIAFYNTDGTARQALKIQSGQNSIPSSVFSDGTGKVYVSGFKSGNDLEFESYTEVLDKSFGMFVAKLVVRPDPDQTDTSDGIFSIVVPNAGSQDVRLAAMTVGSSRDTMIRDFIQNTGSYPIRIDAIRFSGLHASEFQITSGVPPFTLDSGEAATVEFRFTPEGTGERSATVEIITQCDTLFQVVSGEGLESGIEVSSDIDFGRVSFGSAHDSVADIAIKNTGTMPLDITKITIPGEAASQFEITKGAEGGRVTPGGQHTVKLQFRPHHTGRINGRLDISYRGMLHPLTVRLSGKSMGTNVYVQNDSASRGQQATVQLMLREASLSLIPKDATTFSARLAFSTNAIRADVARLSQSISYHPGTSVDTISIQAAWQHGKHVLAEIPLMVMAQQRSATEIHLLEFDWLDKAGRIIDYKAERNNGIFTSITSQEFQEKSGIRFVVYPLPATNGIKVQFTTVENGTTTFSITDILGKQIELDESEYTIGEHSIVLNTGSIEPGVYLLTMQTPSQIFTSSIIVQ